MCPNAPLKSHFFGRRYADDGQGESYDAAHGVGKAQARVENALLRALAESAAQSDPSFLSLYYGEDVTEEQAAEECAARLGIELICQDDTWDLVGWLRSVAGRDLPPQRCAWCCSSRMQAAVAYARAHGYAHVSSSLLYSRYQPHDVIRAAGEHSAAAEDAPLSEGPRFVYRDFRTDWQAGIDFSKEWGVYRQPYCGCVYSEAERYDKKLQRLIKKS